MSNEKLEILALFFKSKYNKRGKAVSYSTFMVELYGEMTRANWEDISLMVDIFEYIAPNFSQFIKKHFDVVETTERTWVYVGYNSEYDCLKTVERKYYLQKVLEDLNEY